MAGETRRPSRGPAIALAFAAAATLSAWNPFAAPVGLLLGMATALVALRLLASRRGSRPLALWALALSTAAAAASAVILLISAGALSTELPGQRVVPARSPGEVRRLLDEAQQRTDAGRSRAAGELERLTPSRPDGGQPAAPARGGPAGG